MIDERIAERRRGIREERRLDRLRRTFTVLVVTLLVVALVAVERSPLVGLEEVAVTGAERLDPDRVRTASQLELGTSTLRLRLGRVEERVAALPAVRDVQARRVDPLTVAIDIDERVPILVARGAGRSVLVDREGEVIAQGGDRDLARIELADEPPAPGGEVGDDPALSNAYRAWRGLTGPLRAQVVGYEAAGPEELVLRLESGVEVRIGRADRLAEKSRALGVVLEDIGDAEVSQIDVRAPSAPVVIP